MSLHNRPSKLRITSTTKSVKVQPTKRDDLRSIIKKELEYQGPDADLNFIDTSLITDMYELFYQLDIRNIKIDQWDVSNVTDMYGMFYNCKNFNCDLSSWDVSKVGNMRIMFADCHEFESDLSSWDVSNVSSKAVMFENCFKILTNENLQPKFRW